MQCRTSRPRSSSASRPPSRTSRCCLPSASGASTMRVFVDRPGGVDLGALRARHEAPARPADRVLARGLVARPGAAADEAGPLPPLRRSPRARAHARGARRAQELHGGARRRDRRRDHGRRRHRRRVDPVRRHQAKQPAGGLEPMSKEIVEAVHVLEREKGISSERLMLALEDALLSAYKKQPGAAQYARVDMDRESADFQVFELLIPPELEEQLLAEVEVEEPTVDPETGEMREPEEPEIDQELLAEYSRSDRRARRHAGRLRPHRRADRQAGDPPADPRGRARHDVRRVPGPRRRADHRHRPAVRLALHARAAARARRGAAAEVRAGRQRALRARRARSRPSSPTSRTRRRARASSSRAARPS